MLVGVEEVRLAEVLRTARRRCRVQTQFVNPLAPFMEPADAAMIQASRIKARRRRYSSLLFDDLNA
jgi:uncharacterized protein YaaQ